VVIAAGQEKMDESVYINMELASPWFRGRCFLLSHFIDTKTLRAQPSLKIIATADCAGFFGAKLPAILKPDDLVDPKPVI
jgi:hypothetical protein